MNSGQFYSQGRTTLRASPGQNQGAVVDLGEGALAADRLDGRQIRGKFRFDVDATLAELRELYASNGIGPDDDIITYCRIGERGAHTWFALTELLGYTNVSNYDGSWTEYGSLVKVPVEVGG